MSDLHASLASAIAWCEAHADPKRPRDSLRTNELMPDLLGDDRAWTVADVVRRRAEVMSVAGVVGRLGAGGRLMVCFPDACLNDCTAQDSTDGYFHGYEVPPWDTWLAWLSQPNASDKMYAQFLLAWVPAPFIKLAERAMSVVWLPTISWIEDAPVTDKTELLALQPHWR